MRWRFGRVKSRGAVARRQQRGRCGAARVKKTDSCKFRESDIIDR